MEWRSSLLIRSWHLQHRFQRQRPRRSIFHVSKFWKCAGTPLFRNLAGLIERLGHLEGRYAKCKHIELCGGELRARAEVVIGNPWAPDPAVAEGAGEVLKIDTRLLAIQPQLPNPADEHRLIRDQAFFYAPGLPVAMNNGIQFSPVSGCLLGPVCHAVAGNCVTCPQNARRFSGSSDPISRLLLRIKRDVCHVCP